MHTRTSFKKSFSVALTGLALSLLAILAPMSAHALTISPPKLEISGNPGETVTAKMTITNDQATAGTYYSSFANFEAQGDSGTPALAPATDDLGTWISVPNSITIKGSDSIDVPISIVIPSNAAPGGHFAAVFWGNQPTNATSQQVSIGAKTGMLVLLTVNGDISESGGVTSFDTTTGKHSFTALPISFTYRFENAGGDRIKPTGDILMKNMAWITGARVPVNPTDGNVLPGSTRKFTTVWEGKDGADGVVPAGFFAAVKYEFNNFAFGRYAAHLKLAYGTQGEMTDSVVHVWVFPWHLTLFVIVLALVIFLLVRTGVRHFEHWAVEEAEIMLEKKEEEKQKAAHPDAQ